MQLVLWAVGLSTLFLQDFLNAAGATAAAATAARKQGLHLRQAHLLETLSEYEVVTPTRVNEFGEPFPAKVHFQRKKRSLHLDIEPWGPDATSSSINSTTQAHYKLTAFGQHFVFNLTAHSGFIAPLFTVSFLGEPKINQTNFYTEEESDIKHCFYKGHVNTEPQHTAVISLCSGMLGTFRSHDGEYFVEPLFPPDQQEYEEEHKKPHLVYRHSVPPAFPPRNRQTCDTSAVSAPFFEIRCRRLRTVGRKHGIWHNSSAILRRMDQQIMELTEPKPDNSNVGERCVDIYIVHKRDGPAPKWMGNITCFASIYASK